jgi:hypothetical protein
LKTLKLPKPKRRKLEKDFKSLLKGNRMKNSNKKKRMDLGFWTRSKKLNTIKKCKGKLRKN